MPIATPDSFPGAPGTTLRGGKRTPSSGQPLATISLVNTSTSAQAAEFTTHSFGQPFKQGDIPAGSWPHFELDEVTPCAATIYNVTSWPDGSMKFCGVILRVPAGIPSVGALTVTVKNGGSRPAPSNLSLADLTAANLSVELTGVTNLTGVWVASLNDAITSATDIADLGDGPAGRLWRIGGDFKQGGTAHGQLYCWHYVVALQDEEGGFKGLRYMGRAGQPFGDVTTTPATRRSFTAVLKQGANNFREMVGHDGNETVQAVIGCSMFSTFFTAGTSGKYDYFLGNGTPAPDAPVRTVHDRAYWVASKLVPPYDLNVNPTTTYSTAYVPYTRALMNRLQGTTGERPELGPFPSWFASHFLKQSEIDEQVTRVTGLASAGFKNTYLKSSTKANIACVNIRSSYAGLGNIETGWRSYSTHSGITQPLTKDTLWSQDNESAHRPGTLYYPYLLTGEHQYLDVLVDQATQNLLYLAPGGMAYAFEQPITQATLGAWAGERNPSVNGVQFKGAGWIMRTQLARMAAWSMRGLAQAAAVYPDQCPKGTEIRLYLRDVFKSNMDCINYFNSLMPQSWRDSGLYTFQTTWQLEGTYCLGYISTAICHCADILPSPEVVEFRQHLSKFWQSVTAYKDLACVIGYNMAWENPYRIMSVDELVFSGCGNATYTMANHRGTTGGYAPWTPQNGDKFMFRDSNGGPFGTTYNPRKMFYAVNVVGNTYQLAETPGGPPLNFVQDVTVSDFAAHANFAPNYSAQGSTTWRGNANAGVSYYANFRAAVRHHAVAGDNVANAVTKFAALDVMSNTNQAPDPKYAYALSR